MTYTFLRNYNDIQVLEKLSLEIHHDKKIILTKHQQAFNTPKGLPSSRGEHGDGIPLIIGSQPPNVRPYQYPFSQKNEIENIIQKLLEEGVIHLSTSPHSSLIVMVLERERAWNMYWALNKLTIKDKFPIPFIDYLLYKLHGTQCFTNLDLDSGYHQIRMKEDDIPKPTYRTDEDNYDFLVIPFGIFNAPSTFQSLMNNILNPYLHKFILVFFDDILIYSKT